MVYNILILSWFIFFYISGRRIRLPSPAHSIWRLQRIISLGPRTSAADCGRGYRDSPGTGRRRPGRAQQGGRPREVDDAGQAFSEPARRLAFSEVDLTRGSPAVRAGPVPTAGGSRRRRDRRL